jgi:uncharacterized MnhB-related membrane protein
MSKWWTLKRLSGLQSALNYARLQSKDGAMTEIDLGTIKSMLEVIEQVKRMERNHETPS